ncbi:MAG: sulfotransferase, partial [Cryomorphaceae bacterium]
MDNIIFLLSQPRSGSTVLQLQLAKHDEIETLSEPWLLLPLLGMHRSGFIKSVYSQEYFIKTQKDYIHNLGQEKFDSSIRDLVFNQYSQIAGEKRYFLDKTPRYYEILPEIYRVFPDAKYIILKRHPLDVLKSIVETWCQPNFENLLKYSRDIVNAPFQFQEFANNCKGRYNVIELKYEDLLLQPDQCITRLYAFLELDSSKVSSTIPDLKGVFGDQVKARNTKLLEFGKTTWSDLNRISSR